MRNTESNKNKFKIMRALKYLFLLTIFMVTKSFSQVATNYTFSETTGTYTTVTSGTQLVTSTANTTTYDTDGSYFTLASGNQFTFNGTVITAVSMTTDGALWLNPGTSTVANGVTGSIASTATSDGIICPLNMDLTGSGVASTVFERRWYDDGTELIFQWQNCARYLQPTEKISFQVRINKSTGVIRVVYGSMTVTTSTTYQPYVGLRGSANTDYNNRRLTAAIPDASPGWAGSSGTTAGQVTISTPFVQTASNAFTCRFLSTASCFPSSGLIFIWTPIPVITPSVSSLTAFTSCSGTASSTQNFTVTGSNMTAGITITPPVGFEVSTSSTFASSVGTNASPLVVGAAGTISSTTIYVRLTNSATGSPSGNITLASTSATTKNVAVSGTVGANLSAVVVSANTAQSICLGNNGTSVSVAETGGGTMTRQWGKRSTSGGTITNVTGTGTSYTPSSTDFSVAGTYYLVCTSTPQCGSATVSNEVTITINALPTIVTVSTAGTYCTSTTLTASNLSSGTIYWQNTTTGGTSTTTPSTSQSISSSNTYYFRAQSSAGCWGTQGSAAIVINTPISITVSPSVSTQSTCLNGTAFSTLSVTATGTSPSYQWYSNTTSSTSGGSMVGTNSNTYTPVNTTAGTLYYYCVVTSGTPCSSSVTSGISGGITTNALPVNPSDPTSNTPQCASTGVTLTSSGTAPSGETWYWETTSSGTATTSSSTTYTTSTAGTYYIRSKNTTTGCWSSGYGSSTITISPLPTAPTLSSPSNAATGVSITPTLSWVAVSGATSYDVYIGTTLPGSPTANVSTNSYTPSTLLTSTTYSWKVVANNGCGAGTSSSTYTFTTLIANDACANATPISCTTSNLAGTTVGSVLETQPNTYVSGYTSGLTISGYGVWYKFTGDGSSVTLSSYASSFDLEMDVYSGTCGTFSLVVAKDAQSAGTAETYTFTTVNGTSYYVYIAYFQTGTTTGPFTISMTSVPNNPSSITGSTTVCANSTGNIYSVSSVSGNTYNWTLPSGWVKTAGGTSNLITVTSGSSGTGTLSVTTTNGCGTSGSVSSNITINPSPTSVSSGSNASICLGLTTNLSGSATGPSVTNNVLSESFSTGIPGTWTGGSSSTWYNSYTYTSAGNTWVGSGYSGYCAYFYTYNITSGTSYDLITPAMDLSAYSSGSLTFWLFNSGGTDVLKVYANNGTGSYTQIGSATYTNYGSWTQITIPINSYTGSGFTSVHIKFTGTSDWGSSNIGLDEVVVTGSYTLNPTYSWTPTTNLTASNISNPVASPTTTSTYTMTASLSNGCTNSSQVVITVNQPVVSTINTAIGTTLSSGDYLWSGPSTTSWNSLSNWYLYDGTNFSIPSSLPTSSNVYILPNTTTQCISSVNSPSLNITDNITKLFIGSGATLDLSSNTISVSGSVTNNGTVTGTGTIKLNGTGTQTIDGTGTMTFPNLEVNKSTGSVSISTPLTISSTLTMVSGDIDNSTNLLSIGTSTSNLGSINWTSGKISGSLKRWFGTSTNSTQSSGIFPLGNSSYNRYAQVNFTSDPSTGGYIIGKYVSTDPSLSSGLPLNASDGQLVQNYETEGYWELTPYNSSNVAYGSLNSSGYSLTLRGNNLPTVYDYTLCRMIKASGPSHSSWVASGTHNSVTGTNTDFNIVSTSVTGFSWFNVGSPNNVSLPIELLSFSADCSEGGVLLTWITASELNSDYFNIERSRDGVNWSVISTISGAGNSNHNITYNVTDKDIFDVNSIIDNTLYYRLKQVDFDGFVKSYDPISINCLKSVDGYFTVYPNPSNNSFNIMLNNDLLIGESLIKITDELGRLIYNKNVNVSSGINLFILDKIDINPGVYYISIVNGNYSTGVVSHVVR